MFMLLLLSRFSRVRLCDPIDGSPPGSPVPGILQARTLEWVAISFSNAWTWKLKVKSQSCPTLSDPMDCSQPGSSVHGIFQARVLERGAIAFSTLMFIAALFTIGKTWEHTFRFLIHFELIFVNGMSKGPRVLLWKDFPSLIQFLLRYSNFLFLLLYFKSLKAKINHVKH